MFGRPEPRAIAATFEYNDPEGAPIALRVSPDGRKTWMACYSSPEGAMQFRAIGKYPRMSIAEARQTARAQVAGTGGPGPAA